MPRRTDIALSLAGALLVAVPFLSGRWPVAALLQSGPPPVYAGCVVLLVLIGLRRHRRLLLIVAAVGIIMGVAAAARLAPVNVENPPPRALRIATWNTEYWDQQEGSKAFAAGLASLHADILILQEYLYWDSRQGRTRPIDRLGVLRSCCGFKHVWVHGELVIASRLDGTPQRTGQPKIQEVRIAQTDIVNVHVPVHLTLLYSPTDPGFWRYLYRASIKRTAIFNALAVRLKQAPANVIVGGDFNSTPLMPDLRRALLAPMKVGLTDLWPSSFPAKGPAMWRLDYLLSGDGRLHDCRVLDGFAALSDHKPVVCWLEPPA